MLEQTPGRHAGRSALFSLSDVAIVYVRIQNNAKSTVEDYVVGRSDDMRDLIDRAVAGYDMVGGGFKAVVFDARADCGNPVGGQFG